MGKKGRTPPLPEEGQRRRGRPPKITPIMRFKQLFWQLLDDAHKTCFQLAIELGLEPDTLRKFGNGQVKRPRKFSIDDLLDMLGLEEENMKRREFLTLMGSLGIQSILPRGSFISYHDAPKTPIVTRFSGINVEHYKRSLEGWRSAFESGTDAYRVLENVKADYRELRSFPASEKVIAEARVMAGMLLANLHEATAPWREERPKRAIAIYDELEREVFHVIGAQEFPKEYAMLLARRAILNREWGKKERLSVSEQQFHVLEEYLGPTQSLQLHVAYRVQQMHLYAVQRRLNDWKNESRRVSDWIKRQKTETADERDVLWGTYEYILGVGYKRFMWHLRHEPGSQVRLSFAQEAYRRLVALQSVANIGAQATKILNLYEHISVDRVLLELQAAELDALVWWKPDEALERARALQPTARHKYPSIVRKLDEVSEIANILALQREDAWYYPDHTSHIPLVLAQQNTYAP